MRLVIKAGSNVLTRSDGKLDITRISALTDQIAWLRGEGHEVILVSSGAVACGRGELRETRRMDSVEQRQLFSALGQARLINLYYDLFREYGIHVGQVLTMKENFSSRRAYLNQRSCMRVMIENGVIPIVNENDTVSVTELMFTDNDELSGLVASMMNADMLIILSNVDGIYTGEPGTEGAEVIREVTPGDDVTAFISPSRSSAGRGGMATKCGIARKVADEGIGVVIADGRREDILRKLITQPESVPHTTFLPAGYGVSGVKKWLAHSDSFAKGTLRVDDKAVRALRSDTAASLRPLIDMLRQAGLDENAALPECVTVFLDPEVMAKVFACDALDREMPSRLRSEPAGEYDRVLGIEGFFEFIYALPAPYDQSIYAEFQFQPEIVKFRTLLSAVQTFRMFSDQKENEWLHAGSFLRLYEKTGEILAGRDRIAEEYLGAQYSEARGKILANAIVIFLSEGKSSEESLEAFSRDVKELRNPIIRLARDYNSAVPEEKIRIRDTILEQGIPGDPVVRRMWGFKKYSR